jgi:hypothetical protein
MTDDKPAEAAETYEQQSERLARAQIEKGPRETSEREFRAIKDEIDTKAGERDVVQLLISTLIDHRVVAPDFMQSELTDHIALYDSAKLPDGQPRWRTRTEAARLLLEQLKERQRDAQAASSRKH